MTASAQPSRHRAQELALVLGAEVRSAQHEVCGHVLRLVVDPLSQTLTHLVVQPRLARHGSRLVPVGLLDPRSTDLTLLCTKSQFEAMEAAHEAEFVQADARVSEHTAPALLWPYFALGTSGLGAIGMPSSGSGRSPAHHRLPLEEVEVRRHQEVLATDGLVGHVRGLVLDSDHQVTHVLLAEGHVFGRHDVAIPVANVKSAAGTVRLTLTQSEIRDLPWVTLAAPTHQPSKTCTGWMPSPWAVEL